MASTKNEKYIIPRKANIADTHQGMKSTDHNKIIEAKILSTIYLYYLEASLEARPV